MAGPRPRYVNPWPTRPPAGHENVIRWALAHRFRRPPDPSTAVVQLATPDFPERPAPSDLIVTWLGHSTTLLQLGGLNILTDPVWADRASPVRFAGPRRRLPAAIAIDQLPPVDAVVISHNHYDHLDLTAVRQLAGRYPDAAWITPAGVGSLVARVGARHVVERSWWEDHTLGTVRFMCVPAQHSSGRGVRDRNRSLWCGWTIVVSGAVERSVYFAGDTAYCPVFAEIASRIGPFDVCLLPVGAYEPRWYMQYVHMTPEEAVRAFSDLTSGTVESSSFVPIHWGTFRIADDPLDEPPRRLRAEWSAKNLPAGSLAFLAHGETRRWPIRSKGER